MAIVLDSHFYPCFAPARAQRNARSWVLAACLTMSLTTPALPQVRDASEDGELAESFDGGNFDHRHWALDLPLEANVRFGADNLQVVIPPGPDHRQAVAIQSRFQIEGDFQVSVHYKIGSLPTPNHGPAKLEVFIEGSDGQAAVIRANDANIGPGYVMWFGAPPGRKQEGAWKHLPSEARSGMLGLKRSGRELRFFERNERDRFEQIGSITLGTAPIQLLQIRVIVPETTTITDVSFDDIHVSAGRLIAAPPQAESLFGPRAGIRCGITILVIGSVVICSYIGRANFKVILNRVNL